MENVMEALMVIFLCIAAGIILCRFASNKSVHKKMDRFTVIMIGIGFILGGTCKALMDPIPWIFGLYVVGAWLCYSAVVFSCPSKEGETHE